MATIPTQKSALNIGAMTFGAKGADGARVHETKDIEAILDVFLKHGHRELDTAQLTVFGTAGCNDNRHSFAGGFTQVPEAIASLKELNTDKLEMWYLHGPDRTVPYEVTLKAVDELYREGHFKRFGISNYMAWEVAEIVGICKQHGYVQPTVYQGIYNAIHRGVEPELFPALRKFGMRSTSSTPLRTKPADGSRFGEGNQGKNYRKRYWKPVLSTRSPRSAPSYRRTADHGGVLIGASSLAHIEQNLVDLEKGPLPNEVVEAA
ncbi:Aldo/keto reductase [Mycena olivaceomarginata]|nr:Aldo/keto reductase [Mycena olivaceomarginata]